MPGNLRFGPFELDRENQCVTRDGAEIHLAPRAYAVLAHLIERPGSLVTKDELLDAVWGELHVTDGALKRCVADLRKALGDPADEPRYIQTLHGRGYRFQPDTTNLIDFSIGQPAGLAPVVGRRFQIQSLDACFRRVAAGTRQTVFLTGEAGLGKTTLVNVFLNQLLSAESAPGTVTVARGRCLQQFGNGEPYLPLFEALEHLHRSVGSRLVSVLRTHAPTWLLHMPGLISLRERAGLREEVFGATKERMLREITDAFEALSAATPIVLVLEDLHWSDPSTIDFLTSIASRTLPAKLMLLATYRPADLGGSSHPLSRIEQELEIHSQCQVLPLNRLTRDDTLDYVAWRFAQSPLHEALAGPLHRRSNGNPLFMVCMLDELARSGRLDEHEISGIVPDSLQRMFEHQAGQLTELEQEIVDVAAAEGEIFSTASVAAVLCRSALEVETACEDLVRRQVFFRRADPVRYPDGKESARYCFLHVLCRDSLYRRLALSRRSRLHGAIARATEALYAADPNRVAAELAGHFELAGDYLQAVLFLRLAADAAAARFANQEAADLLGRAIDLLERIELDTTLIRMDLLEQRATMRLSTLDLAGSAADFAQVVLQAQMAGNVDRQVKALLDSVMPWGFLDHRRGLAAIEEAGRLKGGAQPVLAALADAYRAGVWTYFFGWTKDLEDRFNGSCAILEKVRDDALRCRFLWMRAFVRYGASDYTACCRAGEELRLRARKAGSFHQYFLGTHNLIMGLVNRGFLGEALRLAREGAAMAGANHHRLEQFWLESLQALVALEAFDYEGALPACERIAGEPIMMRHNLTPHVLLWLGRALLGRGQVERAAETFRRLATTIDSGGVGFEYHIPLLQEQASCALAANENEMCRSLTNRSIQLAREHRQPGYLARGYQLLSEVAIRAGDYSAAAEHVSVAIRALAETDIPNVEWQVQATAATMFAKAGRSQESEQSRTRAIEVGQRVAATLSNEPTLRTSLLGQITTQLVALGSGSPPTLAFVTAG
jgi:DNA-binding winged helix-turn-helix (wHTH) protein/tetratricopeptide (TPR) repeat protein